MSLREVDESQGCTNVWRNDVVPTKLIPSQNIDNARLEKMFTLKR